MTLIFKLSLDMVKMYHHTKNEVSRSMFSTVIACTDRQTDNMKTYPLKKSMNNFMQKYFQTVTRTKRKPRNFILRNFDCNHGLPMLFVYAYPYASCT